jgi:hypothetical protein
VGKGPDQEIIIQDQSTQEVCLLMRSLIEGFDVHTGGKILGIVLRRTLSLV